MTFPALPRTWTLDGFQFNVGTDAFGHSTVVNIPEWDSPPGPKPRLTPRPEAAGSYRGPSYEDAQIFTIIGHGQAMGPTERTQLRDRLASLCRDPRTLYPLTCHDPARGLDLSVWVERNAQPSIMYLRDGYSVSLDFQLVASDPYKYSADNAPQTTGLATPADDGILWNGSPGASGGIEWNGSPTVTGGLIYQSSSGSSGIIRLTNSGNEYAPVTFIISATVTNPQLDVIQTQQRIRFAGDVASGSLTIDTKTGSAFLNGINVAALFSNFDLILVPPNGFIDVVFSATSGSGTLLTGTNANVYA
jgi:hypothetical protein